MIFIIGVKTMLPFGWVEDRQSCNGNYEQNYDSIFHGELTLNGTVAALPGYRCDRLMLLLRHSDG
jgi:hypothetical protein